MKTLDSPVKFMLYSVLKAIRHPRTPISYYVCGCGYRFPNSTKECPKCGGKAKHNPDSRQASPIPWWGCVLCIIVGIGAWIASTLLTVTPLGEAARLLVYAPIGHLFGMSLRK